MIILLAGSSELARAAIANRFIKEKEQWRHLPLEELEEMEQLTQIDAEEKDDVALRIACHCALELGEQGFHLIISCPYSPSAYLIAREALEDKVVCLHIGSPEETDQSTFPHMLNTQEASVHDTYDYLLSLLPAN